MPTNITREDEWINILSKSDKLLLVDFHATWCGPCKAMSPVLDEVEKDFPDVEFLKIDVDKVPSVAQKYFIKSIPVLLLFKFGEIRGGVVGGQSKVQIAELLNNELDPKKAGPTTVASEV